MNRCASLLAVLFLFSALVNSAAVAQTTYTVTNVGDTGEGSLRQAILDAAPGDSIVFESTLMGQRILLTSGALSIEKDVTIAGPGIPFQQNNYVEISGNEVSRVFEVQSSVSASISKLIIASGFTQTDGGGLWAGEDASVTLEHVMFTGNTALDNGGAIYNSGGAEIFMRWSSIDENNALGDLSPNGGGIYNAAGMLRIESSSITGNESVRGGGIWNTSNGVIEIVDTIVRNNKATIEGGGIYNNHKMILYYSTVAENEADIEAGGIRNRSADSLLIINSTVSSNKAPQTGGIYNFRASNVFIYNSTIVSNESDEAGAGIFNEEDASVSLYSSIVATNVRDNSVPSDAVNQSGGQITSEGFNIIGARGALDLLPTDQSGTLNAPFNPQLEPLSDINGNLVHVPRSISLAIDRGECQKVDLFLDQVGFLRIIDVADAENVSDGCDVGSVEFMSVTNVANDVEEVPSLNRVTAAYPNPFTSTATLNIEVESSQEVKIELFDMLGRKVQVIHDGFIQGGQPHSFSIEGGGRLSNGVYMYRVEGESISESRSIVYRR